MRCFAQCFQKVLKPVELIDMKGWRKLCQQASFLFTYVVNNLHKISDIFLSKHQSLYMSDGFGNFKCKPEIIRNAFGPVNDSRTPGKFIKNTVYLQAVE